MSKNTKAIASLLFFVGLLFVATSMSPRIELFDYYGYQSNYSQLYPVNITAGLLRNWTGAYWDYNQYNQYWVYIRNVSVRIMGDSSASFPFAVLNITYDADGNATGNYHYKTHESYNTAIVELPGQKFAHYTVANTSSIIYNVTEFLRLYGIYYALPILASMNDTTSRNSSSNVSNYSNYSNSSYNYTNSSSNYSNNSEVYYPDPIYGRNNLTVELPSRNISFAWNMSVYVYNATFYGNSTYSGDFRGRIYAKFNVVTNAVPGWYTYTTYFDYQDVVFDAYSSYSSNAYYNYSLVNDSTTLRNLLFTYYYNVSNPVIFEAIKNSTSNKTNPSYGQSLPASYLTGYNLSDWANASWYDFYNYTSVGYQVNINNATFEGYTDNWNVNGTIYLRFNAYGNNSYTPPYNQSQIWEYDVNATIQFSNNWVYSINFNRPLAIYKSDISNFLRAWVINVVNPYLLNNSSSNTTGILFPEMNITGYYLNNVLPGWYQNYTAAGYYVYVYNISSDLQTYNNDVYGWVNLAFVAFGNDTNDTSCQYYWYLRCNQTTVYSNASIYVNGVVGYNSTPYFSQDYGLRVNASDIQNFLRAYYVGVMVPNITYYYNLTNSTTNRTIYLPNYYNDTQINIDCSKVSYWYCSGANPQSSLFFLGAVANNMSFTVDGRGYGYFNGNMRIPYMANLINFTSTYEGKETIIDNLQGNATLYLNGQVSPNGNDSYYISLNSYPYASARFDRNYFVQNAVQQLFQDRYYYALQYFVNSFSSNGTNSTRYRY